MTANSTATSTDHGQSRSDGDDRETRLLNIVHDLAVELRPRDRRSLTVLPDSDLDRDLGFDSLSRAELLVRIDKAFGVRLPDEVIGEADTVADFLAALTAAGAMDAGPQTAVSLSALVPDGQRVPERAGTLLEVLRFHVAAHGDRPQVVLQTGEREEEVLSYAAIDEAARRVAFGLQAEGIEPGDRVAIMLPTGTDFFAAFIGVLFAGAVPVPIYPPFRKSQVEVHLRRQAGILRNAGARLLITDAELSRVGTLLYSLADALRRVTTVGALCSQGSVAEPAPATGASVALIQYTSGSTGDPKGVVLTHANLLANIRAMGEALHAGPDDVFVSWLPLYHDMGLIGAWLSCLYFAVPTVIMSPLSFLADPGRWLRTISRHRATLSVAPNFAFELCLKALADEDLEALDLASLRMLMNGAEPINPSTMSRFTERFATCGLRPEALAPVYGLAENAVGLAFPPPGRGVVVDRIDREALSRRGVAEPTSPETANALQFIACGRPIPGHQVRIVDEAGRELPERREGRLEFSGPSATAGYFSDEAKTRVLIDGPWLDSGDRAYVADGDIYITGRIKDMIIRAGRNIYPHELEEQVGLVEGIRRGCVAAFSSPDPRSGTERLVVVAETRVSDEAGRTALRRAVSEAAVELLDLAPDEVVLAPPYALPKTSSGKIRRTAARDLFEQGALSRGERGFRLQVARLALVGALHRVGRLARAGGELLYAGFWWSLLVVVAAIVWPTVLLLPRRHWRHRAVSIAAGGFLRMVGLRPDVVGHETIPAGGAVFVVNHASYIDPLVLCAILQGDLTFTAKGELAGQRVAGPFLRRLGTQFVRRIDPSSGVEDTDALVAAARAGARIVAFPEGTLTRMPGLLRFRLGAFVTAARAGVPVVPIAIRGTRSALRGDQWFPRRAAIRVHIGPPFSADGTDFAAAVELRNAARDFMLEHTREPDLAGEAISFGEFAEL